jgi:hypothetical protein
VDIQSLLGKTDYLISVSILKIERSDVVILRELGYGEGCRYIEAMHKREMARRTKGLQLTTLAEAEKIASEIGAEIVDFKINESTEWAMAFTPMKNLKIYYLFQHYSPEFEDEILTFYGKETANMDIPVDDLYDFTRLYANAIARASNQKTGFPNK